MSEVLQADLVELAADGVALGRGVDDEQRDAVAAVVRPRRRGAGADDHAVGVHAAGDERLGAVEHVVRAVVGQLGRRCACRPGRSRFPARSSRSRTSVSPVTNRGSQRCFCSSRAAASAMYGRHSATWTPDAAEAHTPRASVSSVMMAVYLNELDPGAAVLLGHLDAEHAQLAELVVELARARCRRRTTRRSAGTTSDSMKSRTVCAERLVVLGEHRTAHSLHSSELRSALSRTAPACRRIPLASRVLPP